MTFYLHYLIASVLIDCPLCLLGITTYSPLAGWNIEPGDKVAIMVLGGLGYMGVQIANAMGAEVTFFT